MSLPVSGRGDEVYAAVNSRVWDPFLPVDIDLLLQVRLVLVINELHDGLPATPQQGSIEGIRKTGREGDEREKGRSSIWVEKEDKG